MGRWDRPRQLLPPGTLEPAPMLLWASLLVLAPVSGQLALPKPVISLHPPWTTVFKGEAVTLTCNASRVHAAENIKRYWWYLGAQTLREIPGNTLKARVSGTYKCQIQGSSPSDGVSLIFSSDLLILQTPHSVFEGDTLTLRCQVKGREKLAAVKYSWNGNVIFTSRNSQDLLIPQASLNNSGNYQCIGFLEGNHYTYRSNNRIIKIQELFSRPKLEVTPPQPTEGGPVNLSCQTELRLERSDTLLSFIFFRDPGVMLSNWSRSPEVQLTAIWREDSGSYWCVVAAVVPSIRKHSLPLQVRVQGVPVSGALLETQPQGGRLLAGERLVLVCSVAEGTGDTTFSWHREDTGERLGSKRQRSRRAELEIPAVGGSHTGRYYCTADNGHSLARSGALNVTVTGDGFLGNTARSRPATGPGETACAGCPVSVELPQLYGKQQLYGNVPPGEGDLVYSEVQVIQLGQEGAAPSSLSLSSSSISFPPQHASVVYSAVKTQLPQDSAGEVRSQDEDATEGYENVQFA
ncbi:Fc receptor-like protein 4 isoform X4 [Ursus arctos]|uniref:Fc receptor-like protein 4 isoform X4 n=1 Tax=Ursus arctos TaxID=9644 RepID=UPI002547A7FE|nr:Fc receptor-like protein 4 isoform X4 [Ursus arctos]